jgi:hypothetical protein
MCTTLLKGMVIHNWKLDNNKSIPLQRSQIELKETPISLLLFPSSIEYNVRMEITREIRPQLISNGGIVGTIRI